MSALAVFTCRANSHPFQERQVSLVEPVKIGRSVARARPTANNAIFDCKVLSRNHALLWYEEGKFFLQDTKSSNGTFINNQRLSKGSEESPPREIYSSDIVQFGVDVLENTRRVTHSCIIASVQLFHPDGREAANNHSSPLLNSPATGAMLQSQELYQLTQYLQEALHREQMLENKLATLQRLVDNTQSASDAGWQALINEDRLLSRLEILENQLQTYSKNHTEESLRQEIVALQEDKYNYEAKSKESLRKVLEEKLEAVRKLSDLERSLSNTEDECAHLRETCDMTQKELCDLAEKHQESVQDVTSLQDKLQEAEKQYADNLEDVDREKKVVEDRLDEVKKEEQSLQAKVEALQAEADFSKEQLANMKSRIEAAKEQNDGDMPNIPQQENQAVQVELVNLMDLQLLQMKDSSDEEEEDVDSDSDNDNRNKEKEFEIDDENEKETSKEEDECSEEELREKLKTTHKQIEHYKAQLEESDSKLKQSKGKVQRLQRELDEAKTEIKNNLSKISSLEDSMKLSETQMNQMMENAVDDLKVQLNESKKQTVSSDEFVSKLKGRINELESELQHLKSDTPEENHSEAKEADNAFKEEIDKLQELLNQSEVSRRSYEEENTQFKGDLEKSEQQLLKSGDELLALKQQLSAATQQVAERTCTVNTLQDQLQAIADSEQDIKLQVYKLQERLQVAEDDTKDNRLHNEHVTRLRMSVQLVWHG